MPVRFPSEYARLFFPHLIEGSVSHTSFLINIAFVLPFCTTPHSFFSTSMDSSSHIDSSFKSSGDTTSSAASVAYFVEYANVIVNLSSEEVNSCVPHDTRAEVTGLRLLLEAHEYTLVEHANQLSKMIDDLELKDH